MEHLQECAIDNEVEFDAEIVVLGNATTLTRGTWGYAFEFPDGKEALQDQ